MTNSQFQQLEDELGLKLPAAYTKIMRSFPEELGDWPPLSGETANRRIEDFLLDVSAIVKAQKAARKRHGRALPRHSFVFGRTGDNFWLIDASDDDPSVKLVFDGMTLDGPANLAALFEQVKSNHTAAWAKERRRIEAGAKATMTPDTLIAEARRIAHPAVLLVEKGKEYSAVWKGTGVVPPPKGMWEHWISIDAEFLPQNPNTLRGVVSVYLCLEDSDRFHQVAVTHDRKAILPAKANGRRLFAKRVDCVPPMEALFKFGSKPIQEWLRANSVDPNHGINPQCFSSESRAALREYQSVLNAEHPFYGNAECYAMLGGWSFCFMWCYGIDQTYPWENFDKPLVVLTFQDQEPWLEVFNDGKDFVGISRIT